MKRLQSPTIGHRQDGNRQDVDQWLANASQALPFKPDAPQANGLQSPTIGDGQGSPERRSRKKSISGLCDLGTCLFCPYGYPAPMAIEKWTLL